MAGRRRPRPERGRVFPEGCGRAVTSRAALRSRSAPSRSWGRSRSTSRCRARVRSSSPARLSRCRPGPESSRKAAASEASRPQVPYASAGVVPIASYPARDSTSRTVSGSASENMPGFAEVPSPPTGSRSPSSRMAWSHSFRSARAVQTKAIRPPGRSARPMLAKAATGSAKNITPKRLIATSKVPVPNGWTWMSACSNVTLPMPSLRADSRARPSIGADRSRPSARPSPARRAARRVVRPAPQPMSRTRSPPVIAAAASSGSSKSPFTPSQRSWLAAQNVPS